jgi:hypothetical protein
MAFCTTCGSQIAGRFCESCGASAPGNAAAAAPQLQPVAAAPAAAVVAKKTSPIVWILLAFGVLILLFVGAITIGGIFVVHKARQAGLDPSLWQRNPGLAATKMLAAANPDAEIVSMDERGGVVVVRDKKTGKTIRMNFADIKSGRMSLEADGETVSLAATGSGGSGVVEVQSKDGTARLAAGASVKIPSWLPAYSGAKETGGMSASGPDGDSGTYVFKTSDSPATVVQFYESALKKSGFAIQQKVDAGVTTVLTAEGAGHSLSLGASTDDGQTAVTISFTPKK